jgi:hypothetical protein
MAEPPGASSGSSLFAQPTPSGHLISPNDDDAAGEPLYKSKLAPSTETTFEDDRDHLYASGEKARGKRKAARSPSASPRPLPTTLGARAMGKRKAIDSPPRSAGASAEQSATKRARRQSPESHKESDEELQEESQGEAHGASEDKPPADSHAAVSPAVQQALQKYGLSVAGFLAADPDTSDAEAGRDSDDAGGNDGFGIISGAEESSENESDESDADADSVISNLDLAEAMERFERDVEEANKIDRLKVFEKKLARYEEEAEALDNKRQIKELSQVFRIKLENAQAVKASQSPLGTDEDPKAGLSAPLPGTIQPPALPQLPEDDEAMNEQEADSQGAEEDGVHEESIGQDDLVASLPAVTANQEASPSNAPTANTSKYTPAQVEIIQDLGMTPSEFDAMNQDPAGEDMEEKGAHVVDDDTDYESDPLGKMEEEGEAELDDNNGYESDPLEKKEEKGDDEFDEDSDYESDPLKNPSALNLPSNPKDLMKRLFSVSPAVLEKARLKGQLHESLFDLQNPHSIRLNFVFAMEKDGRHLEPEPGPSIRQHVYGWRVNGEDGGAFVVEPDGVLLMRAATDTPNTLETSRLRYTHKEFVPAAFALAELQHGSAFANDPRGKAKRLKLATLDPAEQFFPADRYLKASSHGLYTYIAEDGSTFSFCEEGFKAIWEGEPIMLTLEEFIGTALEIAEYRLGSSQDKGKAQCQQGTVPSLPHSSNDASGQGVHGPHEEDVELAESLDSEHAVFKDVFDRMPDPQRSADEWGRDLLEQRRDGIPSHSTAAPPVLLTPKPTLSRDPDREAQLARLRQDRYLLARQSRAETLVDVLRAAHAPQMQLFANAFNNYINTRVPNTIFSDNPWSTVRNTPRRPSRSSPSKSPAKQLRRPFALIDSMIKHPEILHALVTVLDTESLLKLYSISKPFYYLFSSHQTTYILANARYNAPCAEEAFPWVFFRRLCIRDPAGRQLEHDPRHSRFVPGFKWLQMVVQRQRRAEDILRLFQKYGHRTPPQTLMVIQKIEFLMGIPLNSTRYVIMKNRTLWRDDDLFVAMLFFWKLDMALNDPFNKRPSRKLRNAVLGQKTFSALHELLALRMNFMDAHRLKIKYKHLPSLNSMGYSIFGVPPEQVGAMCREGFGVTPSSLTPRHRQLMLRQRAKLVLPEPLIFSEGIRRRLGLQHYHLECIMYGYTGRFAKSFWDNHPYELKDEVEGMD